MATRLLSPTKHLERMVCATGRKVLLGKSCGTPPADWEFAGAFSQNHLNLGFLHSQGHSRRFLDATLDLLMLQERRQSGHRGTSLLCRYFCKSILSILSRNIDSRSGANAQQRFKKARAPIRSLQICISQSLFGDFCNTICQKRSSAHNHSIVSVTRMSRERGISTPSALAV
jgi:hypothetical protein